MFLKEIEMQGFKSFADKTKVTFDQGVTAVVGPNGSGKSNITESLRWALGESSAKSLRGGKMPDVIFAGTQDRKAQNYAAVKVTLDNSDGFIASAGKSIQVERHIYRNGDSDYLIDGKKVRLKDIHDLFMDTGLGRDSFSIISQGRVEAIFNSKPEERRAIFEEAAGILKYKTRKKETQTKLNQTQDNLDRLEDIIYELNSQIKPLEKQAKTAKLFQGLEQERSGLQLDILVADIGLEKDREARLSKKIEEAQSALADYHEQRRQFEVDNQALKTKRQALAQEVSETQATILGLTRLAADLKGQLERYQLERDQSNRTKEETSQQLVQLKLKIQETDHELLTSQEHFGQLTHQLTQINQELVDLDKGLARLTQTPDQVLEELREDYVQLMQTEADLSNKLTLLEAELEQESQMLESQRAENEQVTKDLAEVKASAQAALAGYQASQQKVAELLTAYQELTEQLTSQQDRYSREQTKLFDLLDAIKTREAKKSSLEAIQKNHSNFYAGVRAVLQAGERLDGIIGAVSQSLTFDSRYQLAMEIALGGASQHIIVRDEAAAKQGIAYLKQHRQGRATFLPLTTIKPRQLAQHQLDKLKASSGYLGLASDLVRFDATHRHIFHNLLGVTAIFETTEQATLAARHLHYQVRLVTLDGTELRPGGSFSGGANRQQSTTFIQPELDMLLGEIAELKTAMLEQEQLVGGIRQTIDQLEEEQSLLKEEGELARLTEQRDRLAYDQLSERLADLNRIQDTLLARSSGELNPDLLTNRQHLQDQLANLQTKKANLTADIEQLRQDKDSLNQQLDKQRHQLAQSQIRQRELQSECRFEESTIERLTKELAELTAEQERLETFLNSEQLQLTPETIEHLTQQSQAVQDRQKEEESKLIRLNFELEDCEASLEDLAEHLGKVSQRNDGLIRQQATLEVQFEQVQERLQSFARRLSEDYRLSFTEALEKARPLEQLEQSKKQLKDLNKQIKDLGPINLEAITQFDEVNERLTFLSGQRDDLLGAKNMLQATIDDMDGEVKARFKTTFEAIRESFKTTFTQMFGGGSADLLLTEPDILTAGVEISVQPPGKKIQSLNLMSGGEKALSALALLFAIIRVKTIPFVILDEVEAALDEANVKRFGDYLNRFDKSSQFIVVTHRKGTMAAADSIYGVTMQESGVSKIVSVKLKEAQEMVK
ncbi:chromosome segregation protein SMC [Streptococcus sp. E17BB]|uniref:chromosome segregation protein SMC n=1 Tax=Streptococcus sp. E17BB TaxID=3278714 RepID=UPI00359D092F